MTVDPNVSSSSEITEEQHADDRRQRARLRELCDEVLASYRVASGSEPLSAQERREARTMLDGFTPRAGRRERAR
jgi:hypothetical protein